jgi:translocation and assembly module TamA
MHITQQVLLVLAGFFCSTTLFAQINVNTTINGIDKPMEDNVRLFLSIEQQKGHPLLTEGRLLRLHKKATKEIISALQPYGYYRPVIDAKLTKSDIDNWQATYTIDAGPPLPIAAFNFKLSEEMAGDEKFQKLVEQKAPSKGQTFSHIRYEEFKSSLARLAAERGYFNAHFSEHRVEIDLDTYQASVWLTYEGGPRYRFGEVKLHQDILDAELLQRYVPFEKGDPYSLNQLIDFQQALNDSYYFQTVEVSPGEPLQDSDEIPILVKLSPRKRHRFNFGLGYGSDTGARAKFGWEIPRVNKHGHRFDTEAKVSQIGYSLVANYHVPVFNPRTDQFIYSAGVINETIDSRESTLRTLGVSLKQSRNEWRESISLSYQREDYVVAEDHGISVLLIPGVNWSRTWGTNFIYAVDGLRFDLDLRGASKELVSDTSFAQLQGTIKFISSINQDNRFITRGTLGSTWTNEFNQLPTSIRFFAGGSQSVRGYSYQSLGPVDNSGQVVGGQYLMSGSIEFEHSFTNSWGMAIFSDAGNAIDSFNDDLKKSVGFGFRWKSPVGTIRLDFASAISVDGNPWRIHINIGPDL